MGELTIHYEGYWQCRQATDPDPSRAPRGSSGYVLATGWESNLDQIIRLQRDEIDPRDFRVVPGERSSENFGVFVTGVTHAGAPWAPGDALKDGKVRWLPAGDPNEGPRFEMRNTITYHPSTRGIFIPIIPFHIRITDPGETIRISRDDPIDPQNPEREIWEIGDIEVYRRRCPARFVYCSTEVLDAIGLDAAADPGPQFDAYFERRKQWLELSLSEGLHGHDPVSHQALHTRLWALTFTDAFEDRLGLQAEWDHDLVGSQIEVQGEEQLGGRVAGDAPWHVRFWFGGFDGDLMRGYIRGTLTLPFEPNS
jgi:hypothetical protein